MYSKQNCLCSMKMKFCLEKSTFSFGLSQEVNNNTPRAKRFLNFNIFCRTDLSQFRIFSYIIRPSHTMRKKPRKKLLSSSYISIRNKTYINFVLAEMIHYILNIEKSQFGRAVLGYRMLFSNIKNLYKRKKPCQD